MINIIGIYVQYITKELFIAHFKIETGEVSTNV